jgi:hypothetical protein
MQYAKNKIFTGLCILYINTFKKVEISNTAEAEARIATIICSGTPRQQYAALALSH